MEEEDSAGMEPQLASPIIRSTSDEIFSSDQWRTLLAICDTIIPKIGGSACQYDNTALQLSEDQYVATRSRLMTGLPKDTKNNITERSVDRYLLESPSSIPRFKFALRRAFSFYVASDALRALRLILSALNRHRGCLLLTRSTTPFHLQSVSRRVKILQSWSISTLPPLRALFKSLTGLTKATWLAVSNTLPIMIGFPSVPRQGMRGKSYLFNFLEPESEPGCPFTLETDVLVVGSGCGAGVCALNLATAGHKVLVVEKGYHFPSSHFPMPQEEAGEHLFENGGLLTSENGSVGIVAGSTWGGGGTVNWSASLQLEGFVREEWCARGLPFFKSMDFQRSVDSVCRRMGVTTIESNGDRHNFANSALLEGARILDYKSESVPQNTNGQQHHCGYCGSGCPAATKQGPANRWLPDAAEQGAHFMEGFEAHRIHFTTTEVGTKRVVGVTGTWNSRDGKSRCDVVINATRVIVCCGTLQSPLLLLRSGLKSRHLGRNLRLHPTSLVVATFDEDVKPWEGAILTSAVTANEYIDDVRFGPKIEVVASTPSLFLTFYPWKNALDYKLHCASFHHMAGFMVLQRDKSTGKVYPDSKDGRCRVQYTPSLADLTSLLEGMLAAARIAYAVGAREICLLQPQARKFVRSTAALSLRHPDHDPDFLRWVTEVRKSGLRSKDCIFGSAHQMGTCRMSSSPKEGVVNSYGEVWGTEGLYVADASIFPSASGVNPMVMIMALADWISRNLVEKMHYQKSSEPERDAR